MVGANLNIPQVGEFIQFDHCGEEIFGMVMECRENDRGLEQIMVRLQEHPDQEAHEWRLWRLDLHQFDIVG